MSEPVVATGTSYGPPVKMRGVSDGEALTRWRDWAHSKLPFAGAAALVLGLSPSQTVLARASVALCAAFGYGVNELADVETDALAGKNNRAYAVSHSRLLLGGTAVAALA